MMHLPTVSIRAGVATEATGAGTGATGVKTDATCAGATSERPRRSFDRNRCYLDQDQHARVGTVFKSYAEPLNGLDEMNRFSLKSVADCAVWVRRSAGVCGVSGQGRGGARLRCCAVRV